MPGRRWARALWGLARSLKRDEIWLTSAGLAFAALFAAISAAAVAVAVYGLFADPEAVRRPVERLSGLLPLKASGFLADQLSDVANASRLQLGAGLGGAAFVALWSAHAGASALIASLNVAYGEEERRSFAYRQAVALAVAVFASLFGVLAFVIFSLLPREQSGGAESAWLPLHFRWPTLGLAMTAALAMLYRYAPSRRAPKWRWAAPGAAAAAALWLAGVFVFARYVAGSDAYEKVFGVLGALLTLLSWFYWTAFAVLIGAELNAALERRTVRDTTEGPELPPGRRGARAADEVDA